MIFNFCKSEDYCKYKYKGCKRGCLLRIIMKFINSWHEDQNTPKDTRLNTIGVSDA